MTSRANVDARRRGDGAHVVMDRVALGDAPAAPRVAIGAASCSVSTVSRPARPGATIFGPPENPAKKCGSTNPVVMRTSASTQRRFSQTGTSAPCGPSTTSDPSSRASWLTTLTVRATRRRASRQALRGVPPVRARRDEHDDVVQVDDSVELVQDPGNTICRGWGRVPSHTLIATV